MDSTQAHTAQGQAVAKIGMVFMRYHVISQANIEARSRMGSVKAVLCAAAASPGMRHRLTRAPCHVPRLLLPNIGEKVAVEARSNTLNRIF
jgi:hypothetical protein